MSRKYMVEFSKLYGGNFNRFTTLVMVDFLLGSTLVSSFKLIQIAPLRYLDLDYIGTSLKLHRGDIFSLLRLLRKRTLNILYLCICEPFLLEIGMSPSALVRGIILELHSSTCSSVSPSPLWTPCRSLMELPHSPTLTFPNCTHQ